MTEREAWIARTLAAYEAAICSDVVIPFRIIPPPATTDE